MLLRQSLRRAAPVARRRASSVGCGFLGAGDISKLHAEGLREAQSPGRLVGLWSREDCDVVTDPDAVAADYGCRRFESPRALVEADDVDAVFVLTNMESHADLAIAAMDAKKHVLVEKPVASTVDELEAMKAAASRNGVVLCPGHNYIYEPWFARTKELVDRGDLGEISAVYVTYNVRHPEDVCARDSMQGVIRQIMTHHAYCLVYLMGAPAEVSAFRARVDTSLDKENLAMVTMSMKNGGLAHLQANFSCDDHGSDPWSFYVKVLGTKGSARYSYNDHVVNQKHIVHSHTYVPYPFTVRAVGRYFLEECVGRGRPPLSTIDDAITCQRVIEAVERSIAESRHVAV